MAGIGLGGSWIATSSVFDIATIYRSDPNSQEFREFIARLAQNFNNACLVINQRDNGYYFSNQLVTGCQWYPNPTTSTADLGKVPYRGSQRKAFPFGVLPDGTAVPPANTRSVPHGLPVQPNWTWVEIKGTATQPGVMGIPIPYVSALGNNIEINVDNVNVNITAIGADYSAYTITDVVLEFLVQ